MSEAFRVIGKDLVRKVYNELLTPGRPLDWRRQLAIDIETYIDTLHYDNKEAEASIEKLSREIGELHKANVHVAEEQTHAVEDALRICKEMEEKWRKAENKAYELARQWAKLKAYVSEQCNDVEGRCKRAEESAVFPEFLLDRMREEISSLRDVLDCMSLIEEEGCDHPAPCNLACEPS